MMVLWAGAMLLAGAGAMAAPVATVAGGVGLAELVHIEAGWLPREDLAVELHAGTVVFNVLVGPAVTWIALGEPRGHQMLVTGALRVNPLVSPFTLKAAEKAWPPRARPTWATALSASVACCFGPAPGC